MTKPLLLALAILLFPSLAHAQVVVRFGWAAPPPLVEVSPGVQIVEDSGDEVFFTNGHYWVERGGRWYWANDFHEHWVAAPYARVPMFIRNHRRGEYIHWRRADHMARVDEHRAVRAEVRHDEAVHAEHREVRHEEHEREHEH